MAKTLIIHDPYRNIDTTLAEFAKAEGVPKYTASHYYWWHKSLDGFRDRPAKGTGNGIKPHTYTRNGVFLPQPEAKRHARMSEKTMKAYRQKYATTDIDEIRRRYDADREKIRRAHLKVTADGRKVSMVDFAKEQGVTYSTVSSWLYRKRTLKGFSSRGPSRVNPNQYRHSGMGESKTIKEWAQHFQCSLANIKGWLRTHNKDLAGFESRRVRSPIVVTYKGKKGNLADWARRLGVSYVRIYSYYSKHNRSLKGFDPTRKHGRPVKAV